MNISQRGINAIKAHEGLRLEAYPDPASGGDPWTIGHGHTQGVRQGQTISAAQAEDFLREDLYWVEQCIRDTVRVPLNQEQYDALCSLIFNIGGGAFGRSTLLQRLNDGDYKAAAAEFMRWDMAAGKRMPGLTKRREAEMALFTAGPADQAPVKQPSSTSQAIPAGEASAPEQTMSFADVINNPATKVLLGLINPVLAAVPEVAKIFMDKDGTTVPERNVAAVVKIADVATKALADAGKPAANMQQVVETLASDPEAKQIVRAAVIDQCMYLVEAGGGGIEGARKADLAISGGDIKHSPSFWVTLALLPLVYLVVGSVVGLWGEKWPSDVRAAIATAIVSLIVGGAAGYYWGQTTSRNRTPAP
mgnify:FL=1